MSFSDARNFWRSHAAMMWSSYVRATFSSPADYGRAFSISSTATQYAHWKGDTAPDTATILAAMGGGHGETIAEHMREQEVRR